MPYYARKHQLHNSLIYHIMNRGNKKEQVFNRKEDYLYFIQLLKEYCARFEIKLYHWALMPNHYHLLLEINDPENISSCMAGLNRAYTHYHHKVYSTVGFLWQGRYKLQPVQKERYLLACGRYIERNPVKANIVDEAHTYPYSSAAFYCLGGPDGITTEDPTFIEFGSEITRKRKSYVEFLFNSDATEETAFGNLEYPKGDKQFLRKLIKENGRYIPKRRGAPFKRIVA
ncbi:MAG: hypothetical protein COV73_02100 [Candidatus Omnitrophica bacterium CG11_big_fil_rev_8_21_14_0_20_43_6]|nr:MAG: hypothetical protein COV73_02100 [Candidatus Omnitrophica bacterium CG11_big_fil_rev_8_21_14_0_20_43_6]